MSARKSSRGTKGDTPDPTAHNDVDVADDVLDDADDLDDELEDPDDIEEVDLDDADLEPDLDDADLEPDLDDGDLDDAGLDEPDLEETDLDEAELEPDDEEEPEALVVTLPPEAEFDDSEDELVAAVAGDDDLDDAEVDGLRDGEFVCRSCFMAKRDTQLADPDRLLCRDCA